MSRGESLVWIAILILADVTMLAVLWRGRRMKCDHIQPSDTEEGE